MSVISKQANWIWTDQADRSFHNVVCFRRVFQAGQGARDAQLRITADARYEVWLNGRRLGFGPARGYDSPWPVDEYDLRGILRPGKNVLAVLVQDWGVSTFQYIHNKGAAGLLAEIDWRDAKGTHSVVTDRQWKALPNEAYLWPVPRVSVQQGWSEVYDARKEPRDEQADWRELDFNDAGWSSAKAVYPAGQGPHATFERRDIPFLTDNPLSPVRVVDIDAVQPAPFSFSINVRQAHNADSLLANRFSGDMFVFTYLHSPCRQEIQLQEPELLYPWFLNGKALKFEDRSEHDAQGGISRMTLQKGANCLMGRIPRTSHHSWTGINLWFTSPVKFSAQPDRVTTGVPWKLLGPFGQPDPGKKADGTWREPMITAAVLAPEANTDRAEQIIKQGQPNDADLKAEYCHPATKDMISLVNVFLVCGSDRVQETPVVVENPDALQFDNADWTTIHPAGDGSDVRMLVDFGDEMVGFQEIELDAPEGTILDVHNFEFIQRDGRKNLAEGMNNTFRYICRDGVQTYRTLIRRGFRYSWLTLRNLKTPVRIRRFVTRMSTYPQTNRGRFACSDMQLSRIWSVGARSVECCSEDTYTDCPTYEQTHWVGDARNEAMVDLVVNGDDRLSRHCWIQVARSLDNNYPITQSQAASGWENILPAWTFLWMRWAQEHYQATGDDDFARQAVKFLDKCVRGIRKHINADNLFDIEAWNMFDWAPMDTPDDAIVTHQNCLAVMGLRQSVKLAQAIGLASKAREWTRLADELSDAINKHMWSAKDRAYIDCIHRDGRRSKVLSQQTHTAAYISGVATGARAKRCREIISHPPKGFVRAGSPFFMFFLLEALVDEGQFGEMIDTIREYWGVQIEAGATTFWEMYYRDAERKARSHCHGWSAAPTYFLSTYVLGIQPMTPGFAKLRIAPQPGDLKWAHGVVPTPHGDVECYWSKENSRFHILLRANEDIEQQIELPATGTLKVLQGKARKIKSPKGQTHLVARGVVELTIS